MTGIFYFSYFFAAACQQAMLCLTKITGVHLKIMQIIPEKFRWHVMAFIYKFRDNIKDKTTETLQRGFRNRNK
jgi:hypothetical protein